MTHVITLMTAKGGSGKTTLARGLLGAADARGLSVGFLDADKTTNTYGWAIRANELGHWNTDIEAYQATDANQVEGMVAEIVDDADLDVLIVDTPGDASPTHEALLGHSDLILCPLTMTAEAVDTALRTANWHYRMRQQVDDPAEIARFRGVINALMHKPAAPYLEQVRRVRSEILVGDGQREPMEMLQLLDLQVRWRAAYAEIEAKGLLDRIIASKAPAERIAIAHLVAARDEMHALLDECFVILESPQ